MKKTLIFSALAFSLIGSLHAEKSGEDWKNEYFKKFPAADTNQDGELSWPEYKSHKESGNNKAPEQNNAPEKSSAEKWKDTYFKKNPAADTNKDGVLSWPEYKAHKNQNDNSDF